VNWAVLRDDVKAACKIDNLIVEYPDKRD